MAVCSFLLIICLFGECIQGSSGRLGVYQCSVHLRRACIEDLGPKGEIVGTCSSLNIKPG